MSPIDVFLGGSCAQTTWRQAIAIPMLEQKGISYYNPQVAEWKPELIEIEAKAKADASVLLFVIDGKTRAIASMIEATEYMMTPERSVILVIENIEDSTVIEGENITGRQLKDLNRARAYLRDVAKRQCHSVFQSVRDSILAIGKMLNKS